ALLLNCMSEVDMRKHCPTERDDNGETEWSLDVVAIVFVEPNIGNFDTESPGVVEFPEAPARCAEEGEAQGRHCEASRTSSSVIPYGGAVSTGSLQPLQHAWFMNRSPCDPSLLPGDQSVLRLLWTRVPDGN
ncbi:hypothetical protein KUCAC02_026474, partial [Chaenocephalus aceratus]